VDGLRAQLRDSDEVELLDLLPVLLDARQHGCVFHRTDPDWNDRGAFFAARALVKEARKWAPALEPLTMSALHLVPVARHVGVLAEAQAVRLEGDQLVPAIADSEAEEGVRVDHDHLAARRAPVERHLVGANDVHVRLLVNPAKGSAPRLAVVGDAVCLPLLPWLAESAQRTTFFWAVRPPMVPIELELPEVVLHVMRYSALRGLAADQELES
jgi:hypothetical protein